MTSAETKAETKAERMLRAAEQLLSLIEPYVPTLTPTDRESYGRLCALVADERDGTRV